MPDQTGIAAAVEAGAKNVQFAPEAQNLPRKIMVIGNYDQVTHTEVVEDEAVQVLSPEDAGAKFGFGFQLHRLISKVWDGSRGIECYGIPVLEEPSNGPGGIAAVGTITFTASGVKAGRVYLRISGDSAFFSVGNNATDTEIRDAALATINADKNLPVIASAGIPAGELILTAKNGAAHTNLISITLKWLFGEALPEGVTAVIVAMSGGSGVSGISTALTNLGTDDDSNELHITDFCQGMHNDATALDDLSTYNGEGDEFAGNWAKGVARPFRGLNGDVVPGPSGFTAAKAFGDGRKLDRTNGSVSVPGSPNHPNEIGAVAIGILARLNNNRGAEHAVDQVMPGILPGQKADRWTNKYENRNQALLAGISPTKVVNGSVLLQNVATFYHPDNVSVLSNGYRSQISISKLQNILWNIILNFSRPKWKGNSLVENVADVSNTVDREKAKDRKEVLGDLVALAGSFKDHAWLYNSTFTIERLQKDKTLVEIRPGLTGFNSKTPVLLSGEAGIFDNTVEFDTSIAVLL
jgi:phage tail sheath gpL-like